MKVAVIDIGALEPSRTNIHEMFDRISRRYDLLNRILSLGMDSYWRRAAAKELDAKEHTIVLDLASGTGDLAISAAKLSSGRTVVAVDKAGKMLEFAKMKFQRSGTDGRIFVVRGDGMRLPFADNSLDATTIAFGIRNMPDTYECLQEMNRILRLDGKVVILEFSIPQNRVIRNLHLFYLRNFVPVIGRLLSGDEFAYKYLNETIETYPHGKSFCSLLERAGFSNIKSRSLTCGVVTIYTGIRA